MDEELDAKQLEEKIHDLAVSMQESKQLTSDGLMGSSYRKRTGNNRLERLADDIKDVFEDLPVRSGLFEFSFSNDKNLRFLIDQVAYLVTDPETNDYEFKKDTRLGTALLGRTSNRRHMAKLVTRYVSEKLLDQQRMLENEFISMKLSKNSAEKQEIAFQEEDDDNLLLAEDDFEYGDGDLLKEAGLQEEKPEPEVEIVERVIRTNRTSFFAMLTWFMLGILATIVGVIVTAFYGNLDLLTGWVQQLLDLITKNL